MDDYYQQFLTSMSGVGSYPTPHPDHINMSAVPGFSVPFSASMMAGPDQHFGHGGPFSTQSLMHNSKSNKYRKKSLQGNALGVEPVKHRRTRSGCFMCRSRRVKCDENRPVCERCKKGNRDCIYPEPPAVRGSKSSKDSNNSSQKASPKSSNEDDDDDSEYGKRLLDTIPDDEEHDEQSPNGFSDSCVSGPKSTTSSTKAMPKRRSSESLSVGRGKNSSPSASPSSNMRPVCLQDFNLPAEGRVNWSHLPPDYQHYLNYFVENVTNFHYSIANDGDDFFGTILPSLAVRHEPLLNALVGFSTYHATLRNPNGKLEEFLKYYNRSVTLLLNSLKRDESQSVLTLLTILQLMTIEEYFGDWVNLMGHQKAAFQIITDVFSPETAMQTAIGRTCLDWYSRYDSYVAIKGGFPTDLPKQWFNRMVDYAHAQVSESPEDLRWKIDYRSAQLRLISYDMSMLYARGSRGQISADKFAEEHDRITEALLEWKATWESALSDPDYLVKDFSFWKEPDPRDIVNPYVAGILYKPPLFTNTLIYAEWHSIMIMHMSQSSDTPHEEMYREMGQHAYASCQYFAAVEAWPLKPKGALIPLQPCISISSLFLPRDSHHHMWVRRKFALLDTLGFIHPTERRKKMAQLFGDPSCVHWWLPNDEGLTPILQGIRMFADERNAAAVTTQHENLREVRHIFAKIEAAERAKMTGLQHSQYDRMEH